MKLAFPPQHSGAKIIQSHDKPVLLSSANHQIPIKKSVKIIK